MATYGGAQCGDRTMLDALHPALLAAGSVRATTASAEDQWREVWAAAADAAKKGAAATQAMRANAGRSSYVPEAALRAVPDPGAHAVATVIDAVANAMRRVDHE